jgi:hypothetical protein
MSEEQTNTKRQPFLQLNAEVPDFEAKTTHGTLRLSEWGKGKWVILFRTQRTLRQFAQRSLWHLREYKMS